MFKFLKSKKGFTLVELMIVVVIMAILVAVAVPIYAAVTANARKKTCIGNQRNIISQVNNNVMSDPSILALAADASSTIVVKTNTSGDGLATTDGIKDNGVFKKLTTDAEGKNTRFESMFNAKNMPFCPEKSAEITVTVTATKDGGCTVSTQCKTPTGENGALAASDHVMG